MSRNSERLIWLAALLTLLGVLGFNYYKAHEHDEALALIAYPPTAYDTPIIPETPEEKERRLAGLEQLNVTSRKEMRQLIRGLFSAPDKQGIHLLDLEADRVRNYVSANFLIKHPESSISERIDSRQGTMAYLAQAMRQGYAPARELYDELAAQELERALKLFREEKHNEAWKTLLPLAAEDYPPAVTKVSRLVSYIAPLGECLASQWILRDALNEQPNALSFMPTVQNGNGFRRNPALAYAWEVKSKQLQGEKLYGDGGLSDEEATIIAAYARATPLKKLPRGEMFFAPQVPLYLAGVATIRTAREGLTCIDPAALQTPPGPPVNDPTKKYGNTYQWWQDAISAPQK